MLVHGGNNTSRCWDRLKPHLGPEVRAVDLPGRGSRPADLRHVGLSDWTDAVVEEIDRARSPHVVLVGHSLAGVIVPAAAERRAGKVVHLVLVAAVIPRPGTTQRRNLPWHARAWGRLQTQDGILKPARGRLARSLFCNDMDDATAEWMIGGLVPEAVRVFDEATPDGPPPPVPATYIRLRRDRAVNGRMARRQVANYGGPIRVQEIDAGHAVMVSRPEELAGVLTRCGRDSMISPARGPER